MPFEDRFDVPLLEEVLHQASSVRSSVVPSSSSFSLNCLTPMLSAPHYLLSSVYCGGLGSAVYYDQNSLVMNSLMEQFEVLLSDALPVNNQQFRHYWKLGDDGLVWDSNPRPRPCNEKHLTTRPQNFIYVDWMACIYCHVSPMWWMNSDLPSVNHLLW